MKRIIIMAIITMLILALALAAYGDQTEVTYTVSENIYTVKFSPIVDMNKSTYLEIDVQEIHVPSLCIKINSSYADGTSWRMYNENGKFLGYTITGDKGTVVPGVSLFVGAGKTQLSLAVSSDEVKFAPGGTYTDTLTFTIE